jgi:hypothetical protein
MHRHAVVVVAWIGCADEVPPPNARLADLPSLGLHVELFPSSNLDLDHASAYLLYDEPAFETASGEPCAILGELDASWEHTELGVVSPGSYDAYWDECTPPIVRFSFESIGDEVSTLRISDDSRTIEATFAAGPLVPHTPGLRSPDQWRFRGGDAVVIGWSHPDDFSSARGVYFDTGWIYDQPSTFDLEARYIGDEIHFTIPDPPPITSDGTIVLSFGYTTGSAATCTGATFCGFQRDASYAHSVVIEP